MKSRRLRRLTRPWRHASVKDRISVLTVVVVALALLSAFALIKTPRVSGTGANLPNSLATGTAHIMPLSLPADPKVVFIGDSWTDGKVAVPRTDGYAYVVSRQLGWNATMLPNGSGTGYLNPGPEHQGTFRERLAALPVDPSVQLVVIQGGINDQGWHQIHTTAYNDVLAATYKQAKKTFPNAQLLVFGPLYPDLWIKTPKNLLKVEDRIAYTTGSYGIHLVDPLAEKWFPDPTAVRLYLDLGASHPNTAGHAYLAQRFIADLQKFEH